MKPLLGIVVAATVWAAGAAAQTTVEKKLQFERTAVMGRTVKNAPYSADEITEASQVLADGTHINRQSQVTVYRDGEGRVRRDTPEQITIWDPVANVSYTLNPKTKTGYKSAMGWMITAGAGGVGGAIGRGQTFVFQSINGTGIATATVNGQPVDPAKMDAEIAAMKKLRVEMIPPAAGNVVINGSAGNPEAVARAKAELDAAMEKLAKSVGNAPKTEPLGKQAFWGVEADGTRTTSTIEAGAIGNDRPIAVVSERWYSSELQTVMMTRRNDPRTGEEIFRLANVRRGEPGADLFAVPPGYTVTEPK